MATDIIIDVECLQHVYQGGVRIDFCGTKFQIRRGQRVAILGPNGSGKSTLLRHILGILRPTSGKVSVFGANPGTEYDKIRARIGAVMQRVDEQLIGPTVFDDIAFAPLNFGFTREDTRRMVEETMAALDISHLRDRLPHYLSGGERKKVAMAGALVFNPELLVLDEPLEGVDDSSRQEISQFLRDLHQRTGMTIISTMHDMELVSGMADEGYVIRSGGRVELYGTIHDLFFEHDLSDFNLSPPAVARIIKSLNAQGLGFEDTLDMQAFTQALLHRLK